MQTIGSSRRIIELFLIGASITEIEELTQIPAAAINVILRSPLVVNEMARITENAA